MILERPQNVEKSTTSQPNPGDQIISSLPGTASPNTPRLRSRTTGVVTDILTGPGHSLHYTVVHTVSHVPLVGTDHDRICAFKIKLRIIPGCSLL